MIDPEARDQKSPSGPRYITKRDPQANRAKNQKNTFFSNFCWCGPLSPGMMAGFGYLGT
jgi:hypothetical protein